MSPAGSWGSWGVTDATVIGSYHIREQLPNQDRALTWTSDDGTSAVVTVADGHGHHAHFRSDVGAEIATRALLDVLAPALPEPDLAEVATEVVARWQAAVEQHVADNPFLPTDFVRDTFTPYGATLLAVATTATRLFALQIGDGDTVAVRASGEALRPIPEDPTLDGIHTASMCQPDPLSSFRYAVIDLDDGAADPIALAFVCTDGFGKARVDAGGWWRQTGDELVGFVRDRGLPWVGEQLPGWLEEPAQIGGDDTTLAVVARVPAASPLDDAAAPDTIEVEEYDPTAPTVAVDLPEGWQDQP